MKNSRTSASVSTEPLTITVGRLRQELAGYPDDAPLMFGAGDLEYYRVKNRGPRDPQDGYLVQIEFGTIYTVEH
jgi:hypothetical protein